MANTKNTQTPIPELKQFSVSNKHKPGCTGNCSTCPNCSSKKRK